MRVRARLRTYIYIYTHVYERVVRVQSACAGLGPAAAMAGGSGAADTRSLDDFSPAYIIATAAGIIYKTRAAARASVSIYIYMRVCACAVRRGEGTIAFGDVHPAPSLTRPHTHARSIYVPAFVTPPPNHRDRPPIYSTSPRPSTSHLYAYVCVCVYIFICIRVFYQTLHREPDRIKHHRWPARTGTRVRGQRGGGV